MLFSCLTTKLGAKEESILSLKVAKEMAEICEELAIKSKWRPIVIAIYDSSGNLKLLHRQDDSLMSLQIAKLKAKSSASCTNDYSGDWRFSLQENKDRGHGIEHVPGVVTFPGGVPIITKSGAHLGGMV